MRWIIALVVLAAIGGGAWMVGNRAEATATTDTPQVQPAAEKAMDCCPMEQKAKAQAKEECPPCAACPAK